MTEPARTDSHEPKPAAAPADRDARIEQLLLDGLDRYFAGQYDQAINVWTRVLFFDRAHARARAYIERARRAQAERQRESEELLHSGTVAYRRGEVGEARRLLQAALDSGAPLELAFPMLERLNQLEPLPFAAAPPRLATAPAAVVLEARGATRSRRWSIPVAAVVATVVLGALLAAVIAVRWDSRAAVTSAASVGPVAHEAILALPTRGEMALTRARRLAAGGSLHDALSALDAVQTTDPQRRDADELRSEIQHQLLRLEHP